MKFDVSEHERKAARIPHEIFLVNLITNHILIFVAMLGLARDNPMLLLITPVVSLVVLTYLLLRGRKAKLVDPWFVNVHWQLCVRRSLTFIGMLGLMALVILAVVIISGGHPRPHHYAIGGVGILPTMITVLVLIVMESDAMHQARNGILPKRMYERFPNPNAKQLEE